MKNLLRQQRGNSVLTAILAIALIISAITVVNHLQKSQEGNSQKQVETTETQQTHPVVESKPAEKPQKYAYLNHRKCWYGHDPTYQFKFERYYNVKEKIILPIDYKIWSKEAGHNGVMILIAALTNKQGTIIGKTQRLFGPKSVEQCQKRATSGSATIELPVPQTPGNYLLCTIACDAGNEDDLKKKYYECREDLSIFAVASIHVFK